MPWVEFSGIEQRNLTEFANILSILVQAGLVDSDDDNLRDQVDAVFSLDTERDREADVTSPESDSNDVEDDPEPEGTPDPTEGAELGETPDTDPVENAFIFTGTNFSLSTQNSIFS